MDLEFSHTLADGRAGLSALLDSLESRLGASGAPSAAVGAVLVAADEVLVNILNHGGAGKPAPPMVEVAVRVRAGEIAVEILDDGAAFDPTQAPAPDTTLSVEEREIGGLGIHLVRKLMDDVVYERRGGRNRLQFTKTYPASSPPQPKREPDI